ncbi:MAG: gluconate 2-dehydrogenase subunit 3 family protein [Myxococcales bacterium]|nr:gluconate 2-dehydrogenase subunit 3 family protein [Myxococcales bacterium]
MPPAPPPDPGPATLERRGFLGGALVLVVAAPLGASACRREDAAEELGPWEIPEGTTLAPRYYAALAALFDALIPGDATEPGATEARAAYHLDQLLGAFRTSPPRIFAGGPYSGRHGGLDGFSEFQPLTRVETLRWRTYLEGSLGLPEREWNGPVVGLRATYEAALDALEGEARLSYGAGLATLSREQRRSLVGGMDSGFRDLAYVHAVEGTYGDPVYGGNFEGRGWAVIDYEGDRQPLGFTAHEMAHPEDG